MPRVRSGASAIALGIAGLASLVATTGCRQLGPRTIETGRVHYNVAIQATGNEQMLLNLVRLRYNDTPFFLEVSSVSTAFEFRSTSALGAAIDPTTYSLGTGVDLVEQPTITYTPLQGEQFVTSLMTPVDLSTLILLHQSGWAVDRVFRICVQEINGVPNAPSASGPTPLLAPRFEEFQRVVKLLRALQIRGEISLTSVGEGDDSQLILRLKPAAVASSEARQLAELLRLEPGRSSYVFTTDVENREPHQISIITRSVIASSFYISQGIRVPPEDEAAGRVETTRTAAGERFDWAEVTGELFEGHHASSRPKEAKVSARYGGRWFYIDESDRQSTATFALLMQLFSLQSGSAPTAGPILTLPVGR